MFALRLHKDERVSPQVRATVLNGSIETATHGGRTRDRVGPSALRNICLNVHDCFGAIAGNGHPGKLDFGLFGFRLGISRDRFILELVVGNHLTHADHPFAE